MSHHERVIMKADKGNCLVVLDREEYDSKMESLLADRSTYEVVTRSPFCRIERELNATLLNFKRQQKIDDYTYFKLRSTDGIPPAIRGSIKHHKDSYPLRPIVTCIGSALITLLNSSLTFLHRSKIVTGSQLLIHRSSLTK